MSISIRNATEEDFIPMCKMDYTTNATHPGYTIPWKAAPPGSCEAFILDRYNFLYHNRHPESTFLVALAGDKIIGYLIYQKAPGEQEVGVWNPSFPEGTDGKFFEKLFREVKISKEEFDLKDCWILEGFVVDENWQRRGVGSMLVKKFLETVDANHAKCYVRSSKMGKSVYEKFGFKVLGVLSVDLKEFGDYEPSTTWNLQRDAV